MVDNVLDVSLVNLQKTISALKENLVWTKKPAPARREPVVANWRAEDEAKLKQADRQILEREAKELLDIRDKCQRVINERVGSLTSHGRIAAAKEQLQDIYDRSFPNIESAPTVENIAALLRKAKSTLTQLEAERERILKAKNPWSV